MPQRPTDPRTLRLRVKEAAAQLAADNHPELADAVAEFLAQKTTRPYADKPNMPLYMSKATWARAKEKAAAEGRTRTDVIDEGYTELLAGRFLPRRPKRAPHGSGASEQKSPQNTRVTPERIAEVNAYVAAHAELLGWTPSPAQVAVAWLEQYAPAPQE